MGPQEAHVFFVDDEPGIRMAAQRALETSGMHVRVFSSGEDCLAGLLEQTCDVLITDLRMEGMDGMSLLHAVKSRFPWISVIVISGYGSIPVAVAAMKTGAAEFLEKPLDRQELLSAVSRALANATRVGPSLQGGLSDAEAQVLRHIIDGRTSREIAHALNRSIRTVESHRHSVMHKFGARNVAQLVQRAAAIGLSKGFACSHPSGTSHKDPDAQNTDTAAL